MALGDEILRWGKEQALHWYGWPKCIWCGQPMAVHEEQPEPPEGTPRRCPPARLAAPEEP